MIKKFFKQIMIAIINMLIKKLIKHIYKIVNYNEKNITFYFYVFF